MKLCSFLIKHLKIHVYEKCSEKLFNKRKIIFFNNFRWNPPWQLSWMNKEELPMMKQRYNELKFFIFFLYIVIFFNNIGQYYRPMIPRTEGSYVT